MRSTSKIIPRLPRNVWVLTAASFLTDVSSEMLANLLPLFLANVLGVRTAVIGLIDGVAETTASLVKVYAGALSDRLGQRKRLAVIGYALSTIAKPFLYFANSWGWVLGMRFADRVGKGIRTAPRDALLAGSVAPEQRGLAFGLHRAGDTAGAFTGLGIAAFIIWSAQNGMGGLVQLTRPLFQVIVVASILPAALAVIVLALGAGEIHPPVAVPAPGEADPKTRLPPAFWRFLFILLIFTLGNSSDAFIILRAQERGLGLMAVMGMLLSFNAVYSLCSGPAGALSDRLGRKNLLLAGWLLYGLVYLGLAQARSGWQVWALFAAYGLFYALTEGIAKALVADLTPAEARGRAYGWVNAAVGLAALPASLIGGALWQGAGDWAGFGPAAPFYFGAGLALCAAVMLILDFGLKNGG